MRVAIVHYHLQGGGVTRVISHLQNCLHDRGVSTVVLTGQPPAADFPGLWRVVPGLQYEENRPGTSPAELVKAMRRAATEALGGIPDLWHVHNHSLGKSLILPLALFELARSGERVLFHIHDFAEDGRPGNFKRMLAEMAAGDRTQLFRVLYPLAEHLHYAVLNSRDARFLRESGLADEQLHLLPNPVDLGERPQPRAMDCRRPLWIYPTRAIRRKNLGEFLLWSAVAGKETRFAVTSAPENPRELVRFHRWQAVASALQLPVRFACPGGLDVNFIELLSQASAAVTTSVAEGFGMAFLEPWTLGVPVCGRDLPEITAGFQRAGIVLPWTYERLDVPVAWLGQERITEAARAGLACNLAAYGRIPAPGDLERLLGAWTRHGRVDFGRLDEAMQETILRRLTKSPADIAHVLPSALPEPSVLQAGMADNQQLLKRQFSLAGYGATVEAVYGEMARAEVTALDSLDGEALLDRFLAPERLTLLRVD